MGKAIKSTIPSYYDYQQKQNAYKALAKQVDAERQQLMSLHWDSGEAPQTQIQILLKMRAQADALQQQMPDVSAKRSEYDAQTQATAQDITAYILQTQADEAPLPEGSQKPKTGEKLESYTFPDDIETADIEVINSDPGGSTGAQIVKINGLKYVYKTDTKVAKEHVENEAAADQAYRAAGVRVPDCKIYHTKDGKTVKLSQFVDGGQSLGSYMASATPDQKKAVIDQLKQGYIVDALAANWDVLGADQDNVLVDKQGRAWRIDNGAAFSFRAQGAKKKPEEFEQREHAEEWRSLRESPINRGVFDKLSAYDIFSSDVDLDAFASHLPKETQKALAKPLAELKLMQTRCHGAIKMGYTQGAASGFLEDTYQLNKGGYAQECPKHITDGDFGFCRKQWHVKQVSAPVAPDYSTAVTQAAISVNKHCGYGSNPSTDTDYQPNMATVNKALSYKPALEKLAKGGDAHAYSLLGYIKAIEDAQKAKWKGIQKIPNVPHYTFTVPSSGSATQASLNNPKTQYCSLTDHLFAQAQAVPKVDDEGRPVYDSNGKQETETVDVDHIAHLFRTQAGDSWEEGACKLKVIELAARGKNWNPPPFEKDVWYGEGDRRTNYNKARKHYLAHPDELQKDIKALNMWRSATNVMLENSDFDGNCKEGRYVVIGRTDDPNLFANKAGTVGDAFPMGPSESCTPFASKRVYQSGVGVRLVPYERIYSCYFFDRSPQGGSLYLNDDEREIGCDMTGLPQFYAGPYGTGWNYKAHDAELKAAFKKYYDANPDLERPYGI